MTGIHIERIGEGYPLVLIHGWGWHSGIWQPLIPILKNHFEVFLIDLPGFGKSADLGDAYTFENIAEQLLPRIPTSAAWLGWSLGGMLAWWLAIHFPERVSHLITVASSPKFVADHEWPGVSLTTLKKFSDALVNDYQKTLTEFLALQLRGSPQLEKFLPVLQQQLKNTPATALPALLGSLNLLYDTDLRADLKKVICPSLHIFGQLDTLVPASIAPFSEQQNKSICHVVGRTGHIPFLTHSEEFLGVVQKWFFKS
jgi:pimeloyl-[acyl-carrier protein] methyl ester esterase